MLIAVDVNHDYDSAPAGSARKNPQPLRLGAGMTLCVGAIASEQVPPPAAAIARTPAAAARRAGVGVVSSWRHPQQRRPHEERRRVRRASEAERVHTFSPAFGFSPSLLLSVSPSFLLSFSPSLRLPFSPSPLCLLLRLPFSPSEPMTPPSGLLPCAHRAATVAVGVAVGPPPPSRGAADRTADRQLNAIISRSAARIGAPVQRDVRGRDTGTDAMAGVLGAVDCAATSVGFPIRNMHTASELAHTGDVLCAIEASRCRAGSDVPRPRPPSRRAVRPCPPGHPIVPARRPA